MISLITQNFGWFIINSVYSSAAKFRKLQNLTLLCNLRLRWDSTLDKSLSPEESESCGWDGIEFYEKNTRLKPVLNFTTNSDSGWTAEPHISWESVLRGK